MQKTIMFVVWMVLQSMASAQPVDLWTVTYELKNTRPVTLSNIQFAAYGPVARCASHYDGALVVTSKAKVISDDLGNQLLLVQLPILRPFRKTEIPLTFRIARPDPASSIVITDQTERVSSAFLKSEQYIEVDDPVIKEASNRFLSYEKDQRAAAVFEWVVSNIQYAGVSSRDYGAAWTLKSRQGDCTGMARVFVALCRAIDIPARMVGGYYIPDGRELRGSNFHNWAEYYDGKQWHAADLQRNAFDPTPNQYLAIKIYPSHLQHPAHLKHMFWLNNDAISVNLIK